MYFKYRQIPKVDNSLNSLMIERVLLDDGHDFEDGPARYLNDFMKAV